MNFFPKLLLKMFIWSWALLMVAGIGLGVYVATLLSELPTIEEIRRVPLNIPLRIYNTERELIAEYGNERRIPVSLDDTPPLLIDAILATEDERFYHHSGVDFAGILRAGLSNLRSKSRGQGASTITMQVARNFFLTPERTYLRKFKEVLLAFKMERALTKDEILELYFNKIFLGHRAYGFAAASQVYYGVELNNLSVPEIAMLAGLPKAPSHNNPISNPQRAGERRAHVLKRLHDLGKIDDFSYNAARQAPITATRHVAETKARAPYIAEMARQMMVQRFGERVYELGYGVTVTINSAHQEQADESLRSGLLAYDQRHGFRGAVADTDLDEYTPLAIDQALQDYPRSHALIPAMVLHSAQRSLTARTQDQEIITVRWDQIKWAKPYRTPNSMGDEPSTAAEVVRRGDIIYVSRVGDQGWRLSQMPKVSGALVSLDANTGAILALTGGFDYYLSKFNRATQALRQPGSNIKPFIYSAALENGFTTSSLVSAGPIVVEDALEGVWRPQNYSREFFDPMRLREALSRSINLVSVRLVRAIGIEKTIQHLAKFGFDPEQLPRSLSLALGSISVTPMDLAAAFAVFANGGNRIEPYLIEKIVDRNGNEVVLSRDECKYCRAQDAADEMAEVVLGYDSVVAETQPDARAISEQNAFLVSDLLQQVILTGTGRRALALKRDDLSGKTGTTNNFRDAWFSGFNRDVVTTVFVGFDEPSHLGRNESGATAALPIWVDYMGAVLEDFPEQPLRQPENIATRFVNKKTGKRTATDDPDGYFEYYLSGTEPDNREPSTDEQSSPDTGDSETLF